MSDAPVPSRVRERRRRENAPGGRKHTHKVHGETSTDRRRLTAEFFHTRRLLASLANNVNQIARATNAGERPGDELHHALRAVREVSAKIDALLPELVSSR